MITYCRKRVAIIFSILLAFVVIVGSFAGCRGNNVKSDSIGVSSKSSNITSSANASKISNQTNSLNASGLISSKTSSITSSNATNMNVSESGDNSYPSLPNAVRSAILLQSTGNTYYLKINPSTNICTSVTLSYENGKYSSVFTDKYTAGLLNNQVNSPGSFYVSPTKTATVINKNNTLVIVYSNDMGKTWNESEPILPSDIPFRNGYKPGTLDKKGGIDAVDSVSIDFITNNCGYLLISGGTISNCQADRVVFKTTNGGKTWMFVKPPLKIGLSGGGWIDPNESSSNPKPPFYIVTLSFNMYNIKFINKNIGFLSGFPTPDYILPFFRTTDGGITCTQIHLPNIPKASGFEMLLAPYFMNGKGYLPVYEEIPGKEMVYFYTSTDVGLTWMYDSSMDKPAEDFAK